MTMINQHVRSGTRRPADVRLEGRYELPQSVRASHMVRMAMRVDGHNLSQTQLRQYAGITSR
jgi:hypothetical protein